jgi:hypothetical protein
MTPTRSIHRAAALTGAAAFLFALAHVSPAAAQTTTPRVHTCAVQLDEGVPEGSCTIAVPPGKRWVIESATVGGTVPSSQYARVQLYTKVNNVTVGHYLPEGFYNTNHNYPFRVFALPGKIMAESPHVRLRLTRGASTTGDAWMAVMLSGYLEDM